MAVVEQGLVALSRQLAALGGGQAELMQMLLDMQEQISVLSEEQKAVKKAVVAKGSHMDRQDDDAVAPGGGLSPKPGVGSKSTTKYDDPSGPGGRKSLKKGATTSILEQQGLGEHGAGTSGADQQSPPASPKGTPSKKLKRADTTDKPLKTAS